MGVCKYFVTLCQNRGGHRGRGFLRLISCPSVVKIGDILFIASYEAQSGRM